MQFFYEAQDATGQTVVGKMEAGSETDVQRRLLQLGYRPQSVAPQSPVNGVGASEIQMDSPAVQSVPTVVQSSNRAVPIAAPRVASSSLPAVMNNAGTLAQTPIVSGQTVSARSQVVLSGSATQTAARVVSRQTQIATAPPVVKLALDSPTAKLGGVSNRDLMFFFQQLGQLVKSGMTVYSALDNLAPRTPNANLAASAKAMATAAHNGGRISDVMAQYPRIYPQHLVGMVAAGELGGFLEIALNEIAIDHEQKIALYKGAWLPKAMATQGLFALAVALPIFPCLLASENMTANLLLYVKWVSFCTLPIALALYGLIRVMGSRLQLPQFRQMRDSLSLKLPPFGALQRQAALFAFARMLSKLTNAGIAPIAAWEGAMNTASNVVIRDRLAQSYNLMQRGVSLPEAFAATRLFDGQMEQLLLTGQQTGTVVESLDQVANFYQGEAARAAEQSRRQMGLFGRLAMLALGGITMAWLLHSCYQATFHYVDTNFKAD